MNLAKLNTELWDVINDCEEMLNEDIAKEIREEADLELLKQVACIFADKCQDEAPADTELYGGTLSTVCALIEKVFNTKD
jgi:hypothetical protein